METTYTISIAAIGNGYACTLIPTTSEGQQPTERVRLTPEQVAAIVEIIKPEH